MLILSELKKTNSRLDEMASDFSSRLDDVEGSSSSSEKIKRKVPARVRHVCRSILTLQRLSKSIFKTEVCAFQCL